MRFGIMALQLEALIPSGASAERLLAQLTAFDHAGLIEQLADHGFKTIELNTDLSLFLPHLFQSEDIQSLVEVKKRRALSYTVHLPLWSVEPSTPLEPVRHGSAQAVVEAIRATQPLAPESYVLHATGALAAEFNRMNLAELAKGYLLQQFQATAKESITWILAQTGLEPRKLAIETIEFPFELTYQIAEELDLSICLDTGHVLVGFCGPLTLDAVLETSLPRLAEVHLHDGPWQGTSRNIGYGQDHQPLGVGDLDVGCFMDRLDAAGFDGPIIFELQVQEALDSLELIRRLRPRLSREE